MAATDAPPARRPFPRLSGAVMARARLWSGLVLFSFALLHFLNLIAGFWSFEAMQAFRDLRTAVFRSPPGTALLLLAAAVHFLLGLTTLWRLRSRRAGFWPLLQLGLGLAVPVFLIRHVWDTRGAHELFGFRDDYAYALWGIWPNEAWNQALLLAVVWLHACIGLYRWLIGRDWFARTLWLWYALAVTIPALAYTGFMTAARAWKARGEYRNPFKPGEWDILVARIDGSETLYWGTLAGAFAVWGGLLLRDRMRPRIAVRYGDGSRVLAPRGTTLLDVSRMHGIPHASVCGGRARCSTCRVRVIEGLAELPPAQEAEAQVLRRVGAPGNVRLACQLRPRADLAIAPLLPAAGDAGRGVRLDRYHWGVEQEVTVLFADLRGFTRLSEGRLPFDVVFLLNQFLGQMAAAIEDSGGHVDKFMGDGVMAIFGMEGGADAGAGRALAAARAMGGVLASLNQALREDLPQPLAMGIGLHSGPAILGRIGSGARASAAAQLTALGETVNVASRLEGLTKEFGAEAVVSAVTLARAGLAPGSGLVPHAAEVRGLRAPVAVYAAARAIDLPAPALPEAA